MKLAIMQPYFFPYLGYWQLIHSVDYFVVYDNIKYTKKGWINRNRVQNNGKEELISLPLKKGSDDLFICDREVSENFNRKKLLSRLSAFYIKAPFYKDVYPLIEYVILNEERNLFKYLFISIDEVCRFCKIDTPILFSSSVDIDHSLKGQDKVLAICKALKADFYINPIGGVDLYSSEVFDEKDMSLVFLKMGAVNYQQGGNGFIPSLSIIDLLMIEGAVGVKERISNYQLIQAK